MGVKGLWQLIGNCGTPVPLESLEQKILAVDVSIWLHQAVRGFKGYQSGSVANVHLLTLFHRICKLLFYRIKPVFVFDGGVPHLKRHVISSRRLRREAAAGKAQKVRDRLLTNLLRSQAVRKALGKKGPAPVLHRVSKPVKRDQDLFELPPLPKPLNGVKSQTSGTIHEGDGDSDNKDIFCQNLSEKNLHNFGYNDSEFRSLPLETQHEILSELQDTRKQNSWNTINEMPQESNNFSSFQMNRLLKRYQFQKTLDDVRTEIKKVNTADIEASLFGDLEKHVSLTHRIISEDSAHSILVKNLKESSSSSEENKLLVPNTVSSKTEIKKDFLTELAKEGIVSHSYNKKENINESFSESSDDSLSDDENSFSSKKLKKMEEAAFLKAVEYVLDDGELTQEEIFSLIQQTKSEVESESPNCSKKDVGESINKPSTSADAAGIIYNSDAESSTDDDDFIDVPEMEIINNNSQSDVNHKEDLMKVHKIPEEGNADGGSNVEKVLGAKTDSLYIKIVQQKLGGLVQTSNVKSSVDSRSPKKKTDVKQDISLSQPKNLTISLDFEKKIPIKDDIFSDIFKSTSRPVKDKLTDGIKSKVLEKPSLKSLSKSENVLSTISSTINKVNENGKDERSPKLPSSDNIDIENIIKSKSNCTEVAKGEAIAVNISNSSEPNPEKSSNTMFEYIGESVSYMDKNLNNKNGNFNLPKTDIKDVEFSVNDGATKSVDESALINHNKTDGVSSDQFVTHSFPEEEEIEIIDDERTSMEIEEKKVEDSNVIELQKTSEDSDIIEMPLKHSTEDLENLESQLTIEQNSLLSEMNKAEKVAVDISDQVYGEAQELIKVFGLPYLVAPMEAEAQCAFLDMVGLTHGTITNDSDVFLFGGKRVYKNFFNQDKHVEFFTSDSIKHNYGLDRNKMISLAMLTGSDYTLGIESVGAVLGIEILSDFPGTGIECLKNFKQWWIKANKNISSFNASKPRQRISRLCVPESFPNEVIFKAYLQPDVDDSREKFSWGFPNIENIRNFTAEKFGWNRLKTDEIVISVLKKLGIKETQMRIDSYFNNIKLVKEPSNKSKRLQDAIERSKGGASNVESVGQTSSNKVKKSASKRSILLDSSSEVGDKPKKKRKKVSDTLNNNEEVLIEKKNEVPLTKEQKKIQIYKKLQEKEKIAQLEKGKEVKLKKRREAAKIFSKNKGR